MKKNYVILLLAIFASKYTTGQTLCIYCYNQNSPISLGVNNLLINGGFENNNCIPENWLHSSYCPNSSYFNCSITNWTCTGGGAKTYADIIDSNYAQVVEGTRAVYFGNSYCNACSGIANDTSCLSNLFCTTNGVSAGYPNSISIGYGGTTGLSLEQSVSGLMVGNTYVLEFWAGGEYSSNISQEGLFAVDLGFGDTLLRNYPTQTTSGIGTRYIIEFNAIAASQTIKFTNWGHICSHCTELILDDVRLYTLPELSSSVNHCTVGIDDILTQNIITVFPNPATKEINIKTNNYELTEITIYDVALRKLIQNKFINSTLINIEGLGTGIYIYSLKDKFGFLKNGKIIKN